jgi:hypothetical protein
MKKNKRIHLFEDIECGVLPVKLTPEMDKEASEFIKAYKEKIAAPRKKYRKTKKASEK